MVDHALPDLSTRDRLLASAVELMAEHGSIELVSLRAVASATGVSPTAVYRHFADHDQMLTAALEWAWAEFDVALDQAGALGVDPCDRLRRECDAYIDFALARTGVYVVLFASRDAAAVTRTDVGGPVFDKLTAVVADVLAVNEDPRDPFAVATQLFTSIHGIAHLRCAQPTFPWPDLDDQKDQVLAGLGLTSRV